MKHKLFVLQLVCCSFALHTYGQGTFIYDQQSSDENNYQEGATGIWPSQPLGQSFTPSLSLVGFIRIYIYDGFPNNTSSANFFINVRSNSLGGTILGTSAMVTIPPQYGGPTDFNFTNPVNVTPGVSYYFQLVAQQSSSFGINVSWAYNYLGGSAFINGSVTDPESDLWFREGIIVPEPSSVALLLGGGIVTWFIRKRQRGR